MQRPGQGVRLRCSAFTSTGRVRNNNEDSIHLWTHHEHIALAIVADGMGGAVAGEEASRIAVDMIRSGIQAGSPRPDYTAFSEYDLSSLIKNAIREANNQIVQQANDQPEYKGMGTTVTMAFVRGSHVILGHVGDSRAYVIDGQDGHIVQVTYDHTFVQALIAAGHISEQEAADHPMKNVLYRALGQAYDIEVDIYYERLHAGDWLLLCSDGLTLHVGPKEIAGVVRTAAEPEAICRQLVDLANVRGGRDNISVIVIRLEADDHALLLEREPGNASYDDEDTLLPVHYPGSSESGGPANQEQRDSRSNHREPPGLFGDRRVHSRRGKAGASSQEQAGSSTGDGTLGEGSDTPPPGQ